MQGYAVHKRITERIHDLLDYHMTQLSGMLTSEERFDLFIYSFNCYESLKNENYFNTQ